MSRPRWSVPSGNSAPGGMYAGNLTSFGPCGASSGAKTAVATSASTITPPAAPRGWRGGDRRGAARARRPRGRGRVAVDDGALAQALGARGADVILADHLEELRAGEPRDRRADVVGLHERRPDELLEVRERG